MLAALTAATPGIWGDDPYMCPGSPAFVHASARVRALADVPCDVVRAEMLARVEGQFESWHDPHNNGTYTAKWRAPRNLAFERLTGNGKYIDKVMIQLTDSGSGECEMMSCSESQVTSILDFGTNYCNSRMLYCGKKDGCRPVLHDFETTEQTVKLSSGAKADLKLCLTT